MSFGLGVVEVEEVKWGGETEGWCFSSWWCMLRWSADAGGGRWEYGSWNSWACC